MEDEEEGRLSPDTDTISLTQCLQLFTEPENLSKDEAWSEHPSSLLPSILPSLPPSILPSLLPSTLPSLPLLASCAGAIPPAFTSFFALPSSPTFFSLLSSPNFPSLPPPVSPGTVLAVKSTEKPPNRCRCGGCHGYSSSTSSGSPFTTMCGGAR